MTSPMGERQMFPVQTKETVNGVMLGIVSGPAAKGHASAWPRVRCIGPQGEVTTMASSRRAARIGGAGHRS